MKASTGDRLVIRGHTVGAHVRDGEILEVVGEDGGPPYVVCWSDDGRISKVFPGSDAYVEHYTRRPGKTKRERAGHRA